MAENKIFTRIQLKYDSLSNWTTKNPVLLEGELAIVYLGNSHTDTTPDNGTHPILFKVGPGNFNDLPFASALAADVYSWAKQENLPVERATDDGDEGNVISSISWDENGKIVYTTASVATSEGMQELQKTVEDILKDIADNRDDWAEKTVDTNTDTQYRFEVPEGSDKLVVYKTLYTLGKAGEEVKVGEYEFLTAAEVAKTLEDYYTKDEIDEMVEGKLHTESDIRGFAADEINTLIGGVSDKDTIENINSLITYVNENGAEIAQLTSDVGTANQNASEALRIAGEANGTAGQANTTAGEAKQLAEQAKETAETAQNSASASAEAAAASADEASESAQAASDAKDAAVTAQGAAEDAQEAAETAATNAGNAQTAAESARDLATQAKADAEAAKGQAESHANTASTKAGEAAASAQSAANAQAAAEDAQAAAEQAKSDAEAAKQAAEKAKADAETAKEAALDSNTSATAIANAAKQASEAATQASNAATQAVNSLHEIATSGSIYSVNEVSTAKNASNSDVECLIFYCGSASDLV